jgi:hypothetical protein
MPTKGFFSQGFCLLTDGTSAIEDVKRALVDEGIPILKEAEATKDWCFSGPSVVVGFRPEVNGLAAVDVVNRPWPDAMGDSKTDPAVFAAWGMGHFGPFAYPGGLERARQNCWTWPKGKALAGTHKGFIRLRTSYVLGATEETPVLPENYDPLAELRFLSRLTIALFSAPGVLCYFNPNGEVLCGSEGFADVWTTCEERDLVPLPLWSNVRLYKLDESFGLMDTVGSGQLDIRDVEAIYPKSNYDPNDIANYLRNVTLYLLGLEREIQTGEAIDGPGETNLSWIVESLDEGLLSPPRRVLRLYPKAATNHIKKAIAAVRPGK